MKKTLLWITLLLWGTSFSSFVLANNPPQKSLKIWDGAVGAGLSMITGNTNTTNLNFSFDLVRDPQKRSLIKLGALYIRAKVNDVVNKDRVRFYFRDDYKLSQKVFLFGSFDYQRDPIKAITYLLNPSAGVGYRALSTDRFQFNIGSGGGAIWEKNMGLEVDAIPSLNVNQELEFQISETARLTEKISGLWRTTDLDNALYHFVTAISVNIIEGVNLKVEFHFDHKSKPTAIDILRNDTATLLSLVYKF